MLHLYGMAEGCSPVSPLLKAVLFSLYSSECMHAPNVTCKLQKLCQCIHYNTHPLNYNVTYNKRLFILLIIAMVDRTKTKLPPLQVNSNLL